jgi:hypothetical protein
MRELLILAIHLLVTFAKLLRPGGLGAVAAESSLLKHQLLISNRSRHRAPNLTTLDRVVLGLTTQFVNARRIPNLAGILKPSRPRTASGAWTYSAANRFACAAIG